MRAMRIARRRHPNHRPAMAVHALAGLALAMCFLIPRLRAQAAPQVSNRTAIPTAAASAFAPASPIAIVPVDSTKPDQAATVTGAIEVTDGKAMIASSGSVTSGAQTTDVILPRRGTLRVCASTTVKLAADTSVPSGGLPGLLMAMDHGAVEMSFATTPAAGNADVLMTPDFRILIGGPGASEVKVRLAGDGDTCVDNSGKDAPYVVVQSLFESGLYRVQPGQRVMFQHGNLGEVVDNEQEPCGCPPAVKAEGNEFPLAESEGLAPAPAPPPAVAPSAGAAAAAVPPLVYSTRPEPPTVPTTSAPEAHTSAIPTAPQPAAAYMPRPRAKKKHNVFVRFGHFLRRVFGGD